MRRVTTLVVGAGQSGLAMSWFLGERSIDHVVLERGEVAHSWRTERWDSLRLLTPNWMTRLPGACYQGDDPDGYQSVPEAVDFIDSYASKTSAPVETQAEVTSIRPHDEGFVVSSTAGEWLARSVVLASGPYNRADLPAVAESVPPDVQSTSALEYRNPQQLADGGVLVVGAGATGVQLAQELQRSGRPVTLAVGGHVRLPRTYRGMDAMWWLDAVGVLDERHDELDDVVRTRNVASFQLVGSPGRETVDLNALRQDGVRIVGRLGGITEDGTAQFSGSLPNVCELADLKLGRLLDSFDAWASEHGIDREVEPAERFAPTVVPGDTPLLVPLRKAGIRSVVWATGFRPEYPWLEVPVLDHKGRVRHDGGVTSVPGLYLLGGPVLRRRKSTFIAGAEDDARELCDHLAGYLDRVAQAS